MPIDSHLIKVGVCVRRRLLIAFLRGARLCLFLPMGSRLIRRGVYAVLLTWLHPPRLRPFVPIFGCAISGFLARVLTE